MAKKTKAEPEKVYSTYLVRCASEHHNFVIERPIYASSVSNAREIFDDENRANLNACEEKLTYKIVEVIR